MAATGNRTAGEAEQPVATAGRWQVQAARARFSTLIDEALAGRPQRISRRGRDVAVVVSAADYDRLTKPRDSLVEFFRNSPLAEAMADGKLDLERAQDPIRDLPW
jgi:prevent-host-death family protein